MLQFIISNKVQKSKQNVQAYLSTGQSQPRQPTQPPTNIVRTSIQQTSNASQSTTNLNKTKLTKTQFQLKSVTISISGITRTYISKQKQQCQLRFNKQDNMFEVMYTEEGVKNRVDMKRQHLTGSKKVKVNFSEGSLTIQAKISLNRKQDYKDGIQKWSNGKQNSQTNTVLWFKQKQQLKSFVQSPYMQSMVQVSMTATQVTKISQTIAAAAATAEDGNQIQQQHTHVKLIFPGPERQAEVEKVRKLIKQMKQQDKNTVLLQIFKIRKQYQDPSSSTKKLKCPVVVCEKQYKDLQQLKSHLKQKHPELSKHGIELSEYDGTFDYGSKAMDLALFIGKMYPDQLKKLIKQTKTMKHQE